MSEEREAANAQRKAERERRNALFDRDLATWSDDDLRLILTERYAPTVIPPCHICGGELSLQRVGGGEPHVWACSPNEDDPDSPGYLRTKLGRGVDEHYSQSQFTDRRQGGDEVVMEAVRRLSLAASPPDSGGSGR